MAAFKLSWIRGFSQATRKVQCFWITVTLAATVGTVIHLQSLISLYLQYDYYESIKNEQTPLHFPDVTFCSGEGLSDVAIARNNLGWVALAAMIGLKKTNEVHPNGKVTHDEYNKIARSETYLANVPFENFSPMGMELNDFVLSCKFLGKGCINVGHFIPYIHHLYMNCYTFQTNITEHKILPGPENGLSLILVGNRVLNTLYDQQDNVVNVNGVKIVIHERGTIPPIIQSVDIYPGVSTNIALIERQHIRLNKPYGHCLESDLETTIFNGSTYKYSEEICEQSLASQKIIENCSCRSAKYHSRNTISKNIRENCYYMNLTNPMQTLQRMNCEIETVEQFEGKRGSTCLWPCKETDYDIQLSGTKWPVTKMIPHFMQEFMTPLPCSSSIKWYYEQIYTAYQNPSANVSTGKPCEENLYKDTNGKTFIQDDISQTISALANGHDVDLEKFINATMRPVVDESLMNLNSLKEAQAKWVEKYFYRLNVYFRKRTTEHHRQVISVGFTDLLSGVGGVLGLWLGFSAMTGVEIFVSIWRVISSMTKSKSKVTVVNVKTADT